MRKKSQAVNQKKTRKANEKKDARSSTTHRFASTAERNTPPKRKTSVGNSTRIKIPVRPIGSLLKAPEGARGR